MKPIKELLEFSIINIDKPSGPTSYQVSDYIREKLELRKTSHMGTLDPAVSGVLPITLNRACKLSPYLMKKEKSYVGIMRLHEDIDDDILKKEMKKFVGTITQMPPLRSSVKRAERQREIAQFDFIRREGKDVLFESAVEAGTYIRTLVNDLGKTIGGAHMLELRRTKAGLFDERNAITLYEFDKAVEAYTRGDESLLRAMLIPAETVIKNVMPSVLVNQRSLPTLLTGKPLYQKDFLKPLSLVKGTFFAVFCNERLIEIARVVNESEIIARPEFVLN
ncbi:MAG: RNA-guided pseudouridylation complex pseudouridine synthase subunit Cbf5 [Nanoarchaeota archaeon]